MTDPNPGTTHKINVHEGAELEDSTEQVLELERFEFEVVNPMFKNGHSFEPGDTVLLDERTAANFLAAGDIKVKESEK